MSLKTLLDHIFSKRPPVLIVMRAADMHRVHPSTDWSHVCDRCKHPVGIYPTGQKLMAARVVELVCNVCAGEGHKNAIPLPGADRERLESIDRKKPR